MNIPVDINNFLDVILLSCVAVLAIYLAIKKLTPKRPKDIADHDD